MVTRQLCTPRPAHFLRCIHPQNSHYTGGVGWGCSQPQSQRCNTLGSSDCMVLRCLAPGSPSPGSPPLSSPSHAHAPTSALVYTYPQLSVQTNTGGQPRNKGRVPVQQHWDIISYTGKTGFKGRRVGRLTASLGPCLSNR